MISARSPIAQEGRLGAIDAPRENANIKTITIDYQFIGNIYHEEAKAFLTFMLRVNIRRRELY